VARFLVCVGSSSLAFAARGICLRFLAALETGSSAGQKTMCCGRVGKKRDAKKTTEGWARVDRNPLFSNFLIYRIL